MKRALVVVVLILTSVIATLAFLNRQKASTSLAPTPTLLQQKLTEKNCTGVSTPSQTEGPYYKAGSPERKNISEGVSGEKLTVTGFVFDKNCKPIANAWLDFWHADANGVYDNEGFKLRGHQFSDEAGKYTLETITPSAYESRPPHIHVKVKAGNGSILTSQLYFPEERQNQTDSIFNPALILKIREISEGKLGEFNFVLNQ